MIAREPTRLSQRLACMHAIGKSPDNQAGYQILNEWRADAEQLIGLPAQTKTERSTLRGKRYQCDPDWDNCFRSSSSLALNERGHASANHRLLIMLSSWRPSPSIAHASRPTIEKRQNFRPHLRQVYASLDPRAADQSSILTVKSCVAQLVSSIKLSRRFSRPWF